MAIVITHITHIEAFVYPELDIKTHNQQKILVIVTTIEGKRGTALNIAVLDDFNVTDTTHI